MIVVFAYLRLLQILFCGAAVGIGSVERIGYPLNINNAALSKLLERGGRFRIILH